MSNKTKGAVFVQITKFDESTGEVTGIMTEEVTDKSGEKMDYATSKKYFEAWSNGVSKATGGKSLGNVRIMHQPQVGGKVVKMNFNDDAKQIIITSVPINDEVKKAIKDGFYTGYSIGGNYVGKLWDDPDEPGVKRYTINPVEVSYVDNPCLGTATFTTVKMDGSEVQTEFRIWSPSNEDVSARAVKMAGEKGGDFADYLEEARKALLEEKQAAALTAPDDEPAPVVEDEGMTPKEKAEAAEEDGLKTEGNTEKMAEAPEDWGIDQVWQVRADNSVHKTKAEAKAHVGAAKALVGGTSPLSLALREALTNAKKVAAGEEVTTFADPGLQKDAKKRYVVDDAQSIRASWFAFCAAKAAGAYEDEEKAGQVRKAITEAWAAKISEDGPPDESLMAVFTSKDGGAVAEKLAGSGTILCQKSLYQVGRLAGILSEFRYVVESTCWEEEWEKDTDSVLPTQGAAILQSMGTYLVEMAREEVAEMMEELQQRGIPFPTYESAEGGVVELAATAIDCVKSNAALVQKAGARNSKNDLAKLQTIHDHATALGAECGDKEAAAVTDVQKVATENADLRKVVEEALPQIKELGESVAKLTGELTMAKKRIKELEDAPEDMPQINPSHKVVEKTQDLGKDHVQQLDPAAAQTLVKVLLGGMTDTDRANLLKDAAFDEAFKRPMQPAVRQG